MPVTLETFNGTRFLRSPILNLSASIRQASWMPKTEAYDAFGTVSYSISADMAQHIRAEFGISDEVRVGVATRASFADVQTIAGKLALPEHAGQVYTSTGSATLTVGVNADDSVKQSVDKDGNAWVNLTLVFTNESGQWVDRPSSLATTSRIASAM